MVSNLPFLDRIIGVTFLKGGHCFPDEFTEEEPDWPA
jgi:hypothetical protein